MKTKAFTYHNGTEVQGYTIYCPGCEETHEIWTNPATARPNALWHFNGNFARPTFNPSVNIRTGRFADQNYPEDPEIPSKICHFYVTNGRIQFLPDCTHKYSDQTVELPELELCEQ